MSVVVGFSPLQIWRGLLFCVLVTAGVHPAESAEPVVTKAGQWQRWQTTLTPQKAHAAPYATMAVDVVFTGPRGEALRVPAFWAEGRGFVVRAAFPSPGLWHWQSTGSDPTDAGLQGRGGTVRVEAYAGGNPLYRHGDLRVSTNHRYLTHADGTPFFWLGDTAWNAFWKATASEWRDYIGTRARQRFSVVQVLTTATVPRAEVERPAACGHQPFRPNGTPDPVYWRAVDEKIDCANDHGLVVMLTGLGKSRANAGERQDTTAFARFVAGRFAWNLVVLSPSMDQRLDPVNERMGRRLHRLSTHLVAQHPGTHLPTALQYHDDASTDFAGLQSGHHRGDLAAAYAAAAGWTWELWRRPPVKPVINLEAMYDALGGDTGPAWRERDVRALGWISWLSGAGGYTYGAGDVPPKVPGASGGVWGWQENPKAYDQWRKAMLWPSAAQMTLLHDFFAKIDWWRLEPAPELARNQPADPTRRIAVARSAACDLLIAYLPDNTSITLDLTALPRLRHGRWLNPVTGEYRPASEQIVPRPDLSLQRPAGWSDAVLLLGVASADRPER